MIKKNLKKYFSQLHSFIFKKNVLSVFLQKNVSVNPHASKEKQEIFCKISVEFLNYVIILTKTRHEKELSINNCVTQNSNVCLHGSCYP